MPPLPSPPLASITSSLPSNGIVGRRQSTSILQTRAATPKQGSGSSTNQNNVVKSRGDIGKENATEPRSSVEPSKSASGIIREKPLSKDGTAQRRARAVEGLKDYQLGHCLGKGAFGSVYCALNWSTGETVAIKQVRLSDMPKTELNVIMQEIDLLKNLHHPNIVKYHGFVKSTDSLYIILEYCEQGSLHSICKNFGKFPENLVALYSAQVLQGLQFLHDQGVIHRDIKGANILTTKEGLVKLADFGVATKQQGLAEGNVVGTPYWMAPEVIELSGATTASDIWSLGCTVIELLDGKPPYYKFPPMPALFRIVNDDHPPLPESASPIVRDFLMQCFQKDPNLRVTAKKLLKHPWIASAKRADTKKPTEYDQAIKSVQQWNEALKASPPAVLVGTSISRASSARASHWSGSTNSNKYNDAEQAFRAGESPTVRALPVRQGLPQSDSIGLSQPKGPNVTDDIWDADFDTLASTMTNLQIPDRLKPQDNFAGLLTSEKLKQYATADMTGEKDGHTDNFSKHLVGDPDQRYQHHEEDRDALETIRTFRPNYTSGDVGNMSFSGAIQSKREFSHTRRESKESQPRTQILHAVSNQCADTRRNANPQFNTKANKGAGSSISSKERFREDDKEDYSDLIPIDEAAFQNKLAGYSPGRSYDVRDIHQVQNKIGGSMRRQRTHTPTQLVHDAAAMRKTRSSLEIQKYAEDADDDDFTDLVFDETSGSLQATTRRDKSPKSTHTDDELAERDSGGLKLSSSVSWGDDQEEDDDDDPFAALEEELDQVDLETNVARDKYARLCTLVEGLISDLKLGQPEDVLCDIVDHLIQILSESPDVKSVIVSSHGMLPILEILETATRSYVILRLLKLVNRIIGDDIEVQENLCFVGGIPIITNFAHKKYSSDIRLEAAAFVRMMYQTPTLTLQMFVSCGGLNVLVEFLEEDYDNDAGRELVLVGVNGIWSVFEMQGPTPKNDFCRIFSRSSVLYPLSLVLNRVLDEEGHFAEIIEGRIVNIFLLFSQAENHVKESVADRMVLKRVLKDLRRMRPQHQITMLKFIKNLSMLATTLDALQNSNAIEVLTDLLSVSMKLPHFREISNQVLNTMYNLCRLSKARQEDAALSGIIPLLQRILSTERPRKEFALPILCDMAHSGKVGRKLLWQNKGLQFYVSLLADQSWAVNALEAILIWLQEETAKVEEHLLAPNSNFANAIVQCFNESKADAFENLLQPLQQLLRLSPPVAASLARRSIFERSGVKLHTKKALVRLNLLRVVRSICDADIEQEDLIQVYGLYDMVQDLALHDPAILVRELANELVKNSDYRSPPLVSTISRSTYAGIRRDSSSTSAMTPPLQVASSGTSMPPTPTLEKSGNRGYFDYPTSRPGVNSPFRPLSREGALMGIPGGNWNAAASNPTSSTGTRSGRLHHRPSTSGLHRPQSRLSLMPETASSLSVINDDPDVVITPTHMPPSANTRSSAAQRRRRQTSGAELGR